MSRSSGGAPQDVRSDVRSSALWGTGHRGGDSRASALWGRGGRGVGALLAAVLAMAMPFAAGAAGNQGNGKGGGATWISPDLLGKAKSNPGEKIKVIIQASGGLTAAEDAFKGLGPLNKLNRRLGLIDAVAVELPAAQVERLSQVPGLTITRDAPIKLSEYTSSQLWPYENGDSKLWGTDAQPAPRAPTIAIVDSGIDPSRADFDFGARVVANVNLSSLTTNGPGDTRGHGTFVAGIAAGSAPGYAGASPTSNIVALDVLDDSGAGLTSDVIAAAEWIVANRSAYNIKVANFSLHSSVPSNFTRDPLDKAVEKLWFSGVTVVAAAGNYGLATGPSRVKYAPGNDPFVITVGAVDLGGTHGIGNDTTAPWSAYGYTYDGFWKPDLGAAGRYMVGPIPMGSTLAAQKAANIVAPGYIQLSGTSFSAPVVAGSAAQILARHPDWTPDRVKGALMYTAKPVPQAPPLSAGVGQVNALRAANTLNPPNPNAALNQFVVPDPVGGPTPVFDGASWESTARANVSWDSVSWDSLVWTPVSWDSASWGSVSWDSVSWESLSVTSAVSWESISWEDAALDDVNASGGYALTPVEAQAAAADPDLAPLP